MLELRVYGQPETMSAVVEGLDALRGVRHVSRAETSRDGSVLVTADLRAQSADAVPAVLRAHPAGEPVGRVARLGVASEDVVLVRLETIGPVSAAVEPIALVW